MSGKTFLRKWIGEYNAVVVGTVASAEAENICLKNGLLFHELLSSFGHLDGLNATIRTGNQSFMLSDAHIRFERNTEMKPKSGELVEKLMKETFEEFEMSKLPQHVGELKASTPSAWTSKMEAIAMRLQAFNEWEMTSHPYIILTVVATSDIDHVLCMQELASMHHTPISLQNGQYDPATVHRLFILLHDAHDTSCNPYMILQQLQSRFAASNTKLLTINSFPEDTPNLQQPDMWSRYLAPRFYPENIPDNPNTKIQNLPINPTSNQPVLGARLSMEDFMTLRNFCIDIYNQYIIPNIEKRLLYLNKQVNDNKKGMKNVLKSFWRKSREDENIKGQVKYRYDKIESQILLLADTSFMIKDYDTAYNMYKLVKDDYKADKSLLHLTHIYIMLATCQLLMDSTKSKDITHDLESLGQLLAINAELPYINAYYSLLASEIYVTNTNIRSPLDSANILLLSVKHMHNSPLLSAMLIEKAAYYFLQAQQYRKYVLYSTISGNKLLQCSNNTTTSSNKKYILQHHASICFATSMLILDNTHWGDLKSKLNKSLSEDMKLFGQNGARRSLLLMLKLLNAAMGENKDVGQMVDSGNEASSVYREIISSGEWGCIQVHAGWKGLTAREIILQDLPITEFNPSDHMNTITTTASSSNSSVRSSSYCEVANLPVPVVDVSSAVLDHCERGIESASTAALLDASTVVDLDMAEEMYAFLELERQWMEEQGSRAHTPIMSPTEDGEDTFADKWAELEAQLTRQREGNKSGAVVEETAIRIPLGEKVRLKLTMSNKLPMDIQLDNVHLAMQPVESFATQSVSLSLPHDLTKEIVLTTQPLHLGKYRIDCAKWNLSNSLCVKQSLVKPGPLLQRTRQQRSTAERGPDTTLCFEVVPAHPLLKMEFEGLSPEVLQGQLLKSTLVLRNEGSSTACDIFIKLSQPLFVFYLSQVINSDGTTTTTSPTAPTHGLLSTGGGSSTLLRLAEGTSIAPGQALRFEAWMMVSRLGTQKVSLLASYKALNADGTKQPFGPGSRCRTSFVSIKTKVLPSLGIAMRMVPKPSSVEHFTMITEIVNYLRNVDLDHSLENFGRDRFSSVGQLDLPDLTTGDEYIEIEDNAIKVVGLWLLGAGVPFRYKPSPKVLLEAAGDCPNTVIRTKQGVELLACPSERIARCFPVKITGPKSSLTSGSSTAVHGQCSWLLPMPAPANAKDKHLHLVRVVEQFLCIASSTARFDREVDSSRLLVQAAELEAETLGPRSIAQVRREKLELQNSPTGLPIESPIVLSDISKTVGCGITAPSSAQDLADLAATGNSLTVAAVWACRWEGKLRWGMHKISTLSFIGEGVSAVGGQLGGSGTSAGRKASAIGAGIILPSSQSGRPAADFLLLGVKHVSTLTLPVTPPYAVEVPVIICLRSLSNEALSVTIAAIDLVTATSSKFTTVSGPQYVYNDQPESTFEKVANLGLRWNGKTQHIGIVIPPNSEKEVQMYAYLTQTGVFDLNRFKVSVRFSQSVNSQLTVKPFMGQSLITVK